MGQEKIIHFLKKHPRMMDCLSIVYNMFHSLSFIRYGFFGPLSCRGAYLNRVKIEVAGKGCKIYIGRRTRLDHCKISLRGNNCSLHIVGGTTMLRNTLLDMYRDGSTIRIGTFFSMEGGRIEAMDGKSIQIGDNCMFSRGVEICNGDNHPIFLTDSINERLNPSADIVICNHVWLGSHVRVLKGVQIAGDIVVGTNSLVTRTLDSPHSVYVGIPAKCIKQRTTWRRS